MSFDTVVSNDLSLGYIGLLHCVLAFIAALVVFSLMNNITVKELHKLPLPIFTKTYNMILHSRHYLKLKNKILKRKEISQLISQYQKENYEYEENSVNISLMIESYFESNFQFFYQTIFVMPLIMIRYKSFLRNYIYSNSSSRYHFYSYL